eukprot:TRINITY_DN12500_c0_g1_i10.p1 TRINITY_DN12500_c0_g1~~TRINITY_DN12500_c0_g1_i10.p1  ORF type:complete len:423 (-),score=173.64 TRINITY_DN12500_c0_g1_i10:91-1359(-)
MTSTRSPARTTAKEDKAEAEEKRRKAIELVAKLKGEKSERRRREEERLRLMEEKVSKESREYAEMLKKRDEELLSKKREDALKAHEQIKRRREEEQKKLAEARQRFHSIPEDQYLYRKLESKYNAEVLMPILEERKRELAQKRNRYKPISKEELDEHMKKHDFTIAQKASNKLSELRLRRENTLETQTALRQYKSSLMERHIQEEKRLREERERRKLEINERREKMENYAKLVKETHAVKPSETKATELKANIEKLKHPVRQPRDTRKDYDIAAIKKKMQEEVRSTDSLPKVNQETVSFPSDHSTSRRIYREAKRNPKNQHHVTTEQRAKVNDYLQELRYKRELNNEAAKSPNLDWHTDLKNDKLNSNEKYSLLMEKAKLIEEQARRKEQLLQVKGQVDLNENVSDMFIDAIKAKLAILENL